MTDTSEILERLKEDFAKVGIPFPNDVKHFYLETNSNASAISVIAESVSLEDLDVRVENTLQTEH